MLGARVAWTACRRMRTTCGGRAGVRRRARASRLPDAQVSAYVLAELLAAAESFTGAAVRKAVISVSASALRAPHAHVSQPP